MRNKKVLIGAFLGLLVAMIICLIVGVILFITANGVQIPENAQNFSSLLQQKAIKIIMGGTLMIVGGIGTLISGGVLLGVALKKIINERNF